MTQKAQQSYQTAAAQAPPEQPVGPFVDTGASERQNAIGTLSAARKQGVSASDRAQYEAELSEASRLLDYSEQFVPRS